MATRTIANGGGNWSATGTWVEGIVPVNGDAVVATASSGQLTVDVASACTTLILTNYVNTLTFNATLTVAGTVTFVSGMTIAGTSDLICSATATLTSGGKTLTGGLQLTGVATYTLSGAWVVNGALRFAGAGLVLNSSTLSVGGGFTMDADTNAGTTAITMTGGTWSGSAGTHYVKNPLTLAGNITVSGNVYFDGSKTLTYSSGTITTTGSTLNLVNTSTLATGGVTWHNVGITSTATVNLSANLVLDGTISNNGATTFTGAFTITAAAWSMGGSVTLSGNVSISGAWTLSANATISGSSFSITADSFTCSTGPVTLTINHDHTITNTATITGGLTINGAFNFNIGGLTTTNNLSGTAKVVFNGTGTWTGAAGSLANNCDINTAGTLTISGDCLYKTGTLTYVAGTIAGSGNVGIAGSCTFNPGAPTYPGVKFTAAATLTLSSALLCTTLTLGNVACTFAGAFGIQCVTLTMTSLTTSRIFTFVAGQELKITGAFSTVGTTSAIRAAFQSATPGSKAKITLQGPATQDVGFADPTDIDSNNGQTIFSYKGTITTTFNWSNTAPLRSGLSAIGFAG